MTMIEYRVKIMFNNPRTSYKPLNYLLGPGMAALVEVYGNDTYCLIFRCHNKKSAGRIIETIDNYARIRSREGSKLIAIYLDGLEKDYNGSSAITDLPKNDEGKPINTGDFKLIEGYSKPWAYIKIGKRIISAKQALASAIITVALLILSIIGAKK